MERGQFIACLTHTHTHTYMTSSKSNPSTKTESICDSSKTEFEAAFIPSKCFSCSQACYLKWHLHFDVLQFIYHIH